jgi:SAM-dependent methyltransferase
VSHAVTAVRAVDGAAACGICGGVTVPALSGSERMFGLGGEFRYDRCGSCGCVQLRDVPPDLAPYYAADRYYTFADVPEAAPVRRLYRRVRDGLLIGRWRRVGALVAWIFPAGPAAIREWLRRTRTGRDARILDVGCGGGLLLRRLAREGYAHAEGVDLFIAQDIVVDGRTLVRKGTIHDVAGPYDLIMFHHSLEHIADQRETMRRVEALLAPGGACLIRIPTVSSFAWSEYGDRWVQLDAPRHLFLHSVESLTRLAGDAGLRVDAVVFDSDTFQFVGSELYRRDRPLSALATAGGGWWRNAVYAWRARRLNAAGRGDQAAFYLRRP